jgi:hypothetical protein
VTILIATGMAREAALMAAPGTIVIAGGGDSVRLERELEAATAGAKLIVSSGLAGALDPDLVPGDLVMEGQGALLEHLLLELPQAYVGRVLGSDVPLASLPAKAEAAQSGAIAVDMESHVARRVAEKHGLPFLALRVISDGADHALPPAALAGMRPDGGIAVGAVLGSLARNPVQLPALIRTAIDAEKGFRALRGLHQKLRGADFDLHQLVLEPGTSPG